MDSLIYFFEISFFETSRLAYQTIEWWAPIILGIAAARTWVYYVRADYISKIKRVLLEVRIPHDTFKSPLAMEAALSGFHQVGREANWYKRYITGSTRPWFSLELVSIGGKIRFFIWAEESYKDIVQASLYAQYPTIEIYEAPDYTQHVPYGANPDWSLWGLEFELTKPDPYPIKTYVDYGLDKDPKEEFKVDPMTQMLEFLGSLKSDEQAWIQIVIRATKDTNIRAGGLFGVAQNWKKEGKDLIKELKEEAAREIGTKEEGEFSSFSPMTRGEIDIMNAIERSISKLGFDAGIRGIYLAKKDAFRPPNISGLIGSVKQFNSNSLNGFKPGSVITDFNYPWQDYKGIRLAEKKTQMYNAYVRRSYFYPPYKRKWFVLNQEELATIFHFPGRVAETPTLDRIESKKAEPPGNLPM